MIPTSRAPSSNVAMYMSASIKTSRNVSDLGAPHRFRRASMAGRARCPPSITSEANRA